jgi:hypothetical protein
LHSPANQLFGEHPGYPLRTTDGEMTKAEDTSSTGHIINSPAPVVVYLALFVL